MESVANRKIIEVDLGDEICWISMGYLYEIFPHFPPSLLWWYEFFPMATTTLASNVRRYVCRETSRKGTGLLAGNCSISLTESEEKINVSHKSPKMFKLLQKAFTSSCRVVVIRSFSQNFLLGAPASAKCNLRLSGHLYIRELKRRRRRRQRERQKKKQ